MDIFLIVIHKLRIYAYDNRRTAIAIVINKCDLFEKEKNMWKRSFNANITTMRNVSINNGLQCAAVTRGHRSCLPLSGVMKNTREMLIDPRIGLIDIAAIEFVSEVQVCVQTAFSFVFINTRRFVRARVCVPHNKTVVNDVF